MFFFRNVAGTYVRNVNFMELKFKVSYKFSLIILYNKCPLDLQLCMHYTVIVFAIL
jgi:hypothetical protein